MSKALSLFLNVVFVCVCVPVTSALAAPDGADWSLLDEQGFPDCHTCHFDQPVIDQSQALSLHGLPAQIEPGNDYDIGIDFAPERGRIAGFMIRAAFDNGEPAGRFLEAADDMDTYPAAAARSIRTYPLATGPARWRLTWQAPTQIGRDILFFLSANAGNDDRSVFEDYIHQRHWRLSVMEHETK